MKERGSQYYQLVFVSRTVKSFRGSLDKGYTEVGGNNGKTEYLKAYKHYVLLECLLKSKNDPKLLEEFNDLRKRLKVDEGTHKIPDGALNEVKTFLTGALKGLEGFDSEGIDKLIDSYIKALKGWAVISGSEEGKISSEQWKQRAEILKGGITKSDIDNPNSTISKLID
jgi:hypothetical protein